MREYIGIGRAYWRLARNVTRSRAAIERQRDDAFRELLHHAWDDSPFYREYYSDHGIERADLASIPVTDLPPIDKDTYREHFTAMATDDAVTATAVEQFTATAAPGDRFADEYVIVHTSGTTAEPTNFVYDRQAWATVLAGALRAVKGDLGLGSLALRAVSGLRVVYVAATEGRFAGVQAFEAGADLLECETLLLDVNDPFEDWQTSLDAFDPNVIIGYPSGVKLVSDLVRASDLELDVFRVVTGAEPLSADLRDYIETTLETEVFNFYGAGESIVLGVERSSFDGMFLFDDLVYVEPGRECTYITPLYNRTVPLIRYRLDDTLEPATRSDEEPLPFMKVESVVGRAGDVLWLDVDDRSAFLHPVVIDDIDHPGVIRTQFVRHGNGRFTVRVETTPEAEWTAVETAVRERVAGVLERKGLTEVDYDVTPVEEIPVDPETGKRALVVDAREGTNED